MSATGLAAPADRQVERKGRAETDPGVGQGEARCSHPKRCRLAVMHDAPLLAQMGQHLMAMRGKMFRPTLVLLCSDSRGRSEPHVVTLAAAVELIHLATLVHDDAVDHSVLRRGMPTLNSLFTHQISVIMGDFLYSIALTKLVALGDIEALRALTRASTEMTSERCGSSP